MKTAAGLLVIGVLVAASCGGGSDEVSVPASTSLVKNTVLTTSTFAPATTTTTEAPTTTTMTFTPPGTYSQEVNGHLVETVVICGADGLEAEYRLDGQPIDPETHHEAYLRFTEGAQSFHRAVGAEDGVPLNLQDPPSPLNSDNLIGYWRFETDGTVSTVGSATLTLEGDVESVTSPA